ncbi:MAG: ATP-binding cassette domain-containing protein [Elusimicrobiales bacterium]|nr:ATP-binding cassette domain-containing protein [Elusimicrobiales bacterium]
MTGLSVKNISKAYRVELPREDALSVLMRFFSGRSPSRPFSALDGISFELKPGTALALCGRNGSGKTTLLKILAGITEPSGGSCSYPGKTACLLGFASILQDRLSVKENARLCAVFFGLPGAPAENAERVMAAAGLAHLRNARAGELSAGMKLRLPFMAALASGAGLFLIDETLAVGDAGFRELCLSRLKELQRAGAILVFATHDHALARGFADLALVLENGRQAYLGPAAGLPSPGAAEPPGAAFRRGLERYSLLYGKLKAAGFRLGEALPASDEQLLLVHTPGWLARLKAADLTPAEEEALALPYSKQIFPLAWRMAGGTLTAARAALASGLGVFAPGGGHHAFPDRGEGFCPVNDIAIAAKVLLKEGLVGSPAVIDLDAHQGNGTAFIFSGGEAKTFSAHRAGGYPPQRVRSAMDLDLPDGADDAVYLAAVKKGLKDFLELAKPDFVFALCTADAWEQDPLGGLRVSAAGLKERDAFLFALLAQKKIPACLLLGGAYGEPVGAAQINFNTIEAAAAAFPSFDKIVSV